MTLVRFDFFSASPNSEWLGAAIVQADNFSQRLIADKRAAEAAKVEGFDPAKSFGRIIYSDDKALWSQ